jgi:ring-1,2-phenylacetyl-CoA epoxidase subunit PaaC
MPVTSPTAAPFAIPAVRRIPPPPLNPALLELEPGVREAYRDLLMFLADSELVIGHRNSEWTGFAPSAEEDVAFSSIAQDEMGHAHLYYALLVGADDEEAVDRLALDRGPRAFRHLPLLHAPNGDWFFTTARHLCWDLFEDVLLRRALESDLPLLAGAARRVLNEEQYHLEHADQWLALLSRTRRTRLRLARALGRVAAIGGNPALAAPGLEVLARSGAFSATADLAAAYREGLLGRLRDACWGPPAVELIERELSHGASATAPPGLLNLHRDLTGLRRAHPGASW